MDSRLITRLYEAAHDGNVDALKKLLAEDPLLLDRAITTTEVSDNPLHIACVLGHAAFAKEVLRLRPNLAGEFNGRGLTPLHLAASQGHLAVVLELIQANIHACRIRESKDGYMPVHAAVIKGRVDVASVLLQRCEDTLVEVTHRRETLLHLAIKAYSLEAVNLLAARDQTLINAQDHRGNTCLHLAVARRQQQVIIHLLSFDVTDINAPNSVGLTPLDILLETTQETGDVFIGDMLRRSGARTSADINPNNPGDNKNYLTTDKKTKNFTNADERSTDTLIVVAALVAAVTYQAIFNPPGGSIQMPFEISDGNNNNVTLTNSSSNFYENWPKFPSKDYPVGKPALLWYLNGFIIADSIALYLSSITILLVLSGCHRKSKLVMKTVVGTLWISIICMLLAFSLAFSKTYVHPSKNDTALRVVQYLLYIALWVCGMGSLMQLIRANQFGTEKLQSWLSEFGWWPKAQRSILFVVRVAFWLIYGSYTIALGVLVVILLRLAGKVVE